MAVNGIVNSINTKLRMTGMVSGLDTDTLVKQMLATEQARIDKVVQKRQISLWKTESYREVTSTLQSFYSEYFDSLSSKNLKSTSSFSSYAASYSSTTASNYVTVNPGVSAKAGTYKITAMEKAQAAKTTGENVSRSIEGVQITESVENITNENGNNVLTIVLNGVAKQIKLNDDTVSTDVDGLLLELNTEIEAAFGAGHVTVDYDPDNDGQNGFVFTVNKTDTFSMGMNDETAEVLGLKDANKSNKMDLYSNIFDISSTFADENLESILTGEAGDISFSINGKNFTFDSRTTSLNTIMKTVNADTTINASMKYDITSNSFILESKSTGASSKLEIAESSDGLMKALGFTTNSTISGKDALIKIKGIGGSDQTIDIIRPNNNFTYDGLTFDIKKNLVEGTDEPIEVTVASDTSKTYEYIKGFVDKYNEIIKKFNDKISEKIYSDYAPLTDEEKESLSEDQIKKWEEKAKSGLLKNDSIISSTLQSMRSALYAAVEGVGITLSSIGITTSSDYTDKGKLEINEAKLKEALTNRPEEVQKLFTANSDISYYEAINDPAKKVERDKGLGIAQKLSDILQDAIRTNTDSNGYKGRLLEKAGLVGDRSESTNMLYKEIMGFDKQITEMNNRLGDREDALYARFTALETALSKMSSQQAWLTQQLGGNSQ